MHLLVFLPSVIHRILWFNNMSTPGGLRGHKLNTFHII